MALAFNGEVVRFLATVIVGLSLCLGEVRGDTPRIDFETSKGTPAEEATVQLLRKISNRSDLGPWLFTRRVRVEAGVVPHDSPILTLNTRHNERPDVLLSTLLHEQLHLWVSSRPESTAAAIEELKSAFPGLPVGGRDGAKSEESNYAHLIIIYLELRSVESLIGKKRADAVGKFLEGDHYRALYTLVRSRKSQVGDVVRENGLLCCGVES
jgi:hypothetical protein